MNVVTKVNMREYCRLTQTLHITNLKLVFRSSLCMAYYYKVYTFHIRSWYTFGVSVHSTSFIKYNSFAYSYTNDHSNKMIWFFRRTLHPNCNCATKFDAHDWYESLLVMVPLIPAVPVIISLWLYFGCYEPLKRFLNTFCTPIGHSSRLRKALLERGRSKLSIRLGS